MDRRPFAKLFTQPTPLSRLPSTPAAPQGEGWLRYIPSTSRSVRHCQLTQDRPHRFVRDAYLPGDAAQRPVGGSQSGNALTRRQVYLGTRLGQRGAPGAPDARNVRGPGEDDAIALFGGTPPDDGMILASQAYAYLHAAELQEKLGACLGL